LEMKSLKRNNFAVFVFLAFSFLLVRSQPYSNGIGFAFSGAGGRIAQHVALMESLVKGLYPGGTKIRPSYLAGASSGAISAVALNAILKTEDQHLPNGFDWDLYKKLVFALENSEVFDDSWEGIAKIFTYNIYEGYLLDNSPLEKLLSTYLNKMGFSKMKDLYLPTSISIVNQSSGEDVRVWSTDPFYGELPIIDVLMASASLPIAFPPRIIPSLGAQTNWIDGGTGIDTIPVEPLLNHPNVTEIYVICYNSALTSGGAGPLPFPLDDINLLVNTMALISDMRVDLYAGALDMVAEAPFPSYSYIPQLNQTFSALDFSDEKLEYDLTMSWAVENNPVRITPIKDSKKKSMYEGKRRYSNNLQL